MINCSKPLTKKKKKNEQTKTNTETYKKIYPTSKDK